MSVEYASTSRSGNSVRSEAVVVLYRYLRVSNMWLQPGLSYGEEGDSGCRVTCDVLREIRDLPLTRAVSGRGH